jgi:RNA polymerase sigma-70 factor (ECF subfamily)
MTDSTSEWDGVDAFLRDVETPLFSYIRRLLRNREDADDVYQETVARVLQLARRGRLRDNGRHTRALLFTIAHNLAVDQHRLRRWTAEPAEGTEASPDEPLAGVLARQQLDMALDELPDVQRQALLLRVFGELSYNEIAQGLSATEGQVKTWVYRARKRLAELLDADGQYIGGPTGENPRDE